MGLLLLGGICIAGFGIAVCVVRWFLRHCWLGDRGGYWPVERRGYGRARRRSVTLTAFVSAALCLGTFAAAFVILMVLLAVVSDAGGDAVLHALTDVVQWLRKTLRP